MSLAEIVQITVDRATRGVDRASFGRALLLAPHRLYYPTTTLGAASRTKLYADAAELRTDQASAADDLLDAAVAYFAQTPKPTHLRLGRVAPDDTATVRAVTVTNNSVYRIRVDGIEFTFTTDATATATEIRDGLVAAINAGLAILSKDAALNTITLAAALGNISAQFPAGRKFRITGATTAGNNILYRVAAAGASFVGGSTVIPVEQDVLAEGAAQGVVRPRATAAAAAADTFTLVPRDGGDVLPAAAADRDYLLSTGTEARLRAEHTFTETATTALDAIVEEIDDWYAVGTSIRDRAGAPAGDLTFLRDVQAWVEARRKIASLASSVAAVRDTTDAADNPLTGTEPQRAHGLARARTLWNWHSEVGPSTESVGVVAQRDQYPDMATLGRLLPTDPGAATWSFKTLAGVTADVHSTNQRANLRAKFVNYYSAVAGRNITRWGTVAAGEYVDVIVFIDWLHARLSEELYTILVNNDKLPYTDAGIAAVEAAVRRVLQQGIDVGGIATINSVTVPKAIDTAVADRAARVLRGVRFNARLAGAIHEIIVVGEVVV